MVIAFTEILGATTALLKSQEFVEAVYRIVALAPSTVIPPPFAAELSAAPEAKTMFLSSISSVVELMVVVVPSTCRLPAMITVPALPGVCGSSVRLPLVVAIVLPLISILSTVSLESPSISESTLTVTLVVFALTPPEIIRFSPVVNSPVPAIDVSPSTSKTVKVST